MRSPAGNPSTGVLAAMWLTVSRRRPAVASQPTAVAGHAFAGRMSWARWAGDFAAKGWELGGISVRA